MFSLTTLISSLAYFYMIYERNVQIKYILKPLTTLLIIGVCQESSKAVSTPKLAGLLFSLFGDIFLMFEGDLMFTLGLGSFLIAHVFYINVFYSSKKVSSSTSIFAVLALIATSYYSYLFSSILEQGGYVMVVAVFVYVSAITLMVYYALLNNAWLALGAVLFMISDSTLAFDKFIVNQAEAQYEYAVMVTYWAAQYLIARF